MGHYSNVPIQTEWMPRLLQQLLATEHLAFNNSILGPSGSFLADAPGISPAPTTARGPKEGQREFSFLSREQIQIRERHAENKNVRADRCRDHNDNNACVSSSLITAEVCLMTLLSRCGQLDQETWQPSQTPGVALHSSPPCS